MTLEERKEYLEACLNDAVIAGNVALTDSFTYRLNHLNKQIREKTVQTYYGTKRVKAKPMTRAAYSSYCGWELPADESGADEGYLVEYQDSPNSNHHAHKGYISWSPTSVFVEAYKQDGNLSFGHALEALKSGEKVARKGWNGKGMFIFLVKGSTFKVNRAPLLGIYAEGTEISYCPHIDMRTVDGSVVPWLASQSDMLAIDWFLVE